MKDLLFKSYWGKKVIVIIISLSIPIAIVVFTLLIEFFARTYSG